MEDAPQDGPLQAADPRNAAPTAHTPVAANGDGGRGFERTRTSGPASDYRDRRGYDPAFLGDGAEFQVRLPDLSPDQAEEAAIADPLASGMDRFVLAYTHFSVVMNGRRRMPFFSAANIDGNELRSIPRSGDAWAYDPRIGRELQIGDEIYANSPLDRGHMTRRLDPVWGTAAVAALADEDTFHFTNACPQHRDLNRKEWAQLEDYVLDNAGTADVRVCSMTGPVLAASDTPFRGVLLPASFWKVVVTVRTETRRLSAAGYILSQQDLLTGFEFSYGPYKTYQVTLREIERRTGLRFGELTNFDPMSPSRVGGFESSGGVAKPIRGPADLVL
jgi:endonuclease G